MKSNYTIYILIFHVLFVAVFCNQTKENNYEGYVLPKQKLQGTQHGFLYDLKNPTKKIKLPMELVEISALSYFKKDHLLTLHDENADIYSIDYRQDNIVDHFISEQKGDFEGIEYVDKKVYLLKSNGLIIEHSYFNKKKHKSEYFKTLLGQKNDTEGLGYDTKSNSLLIACKNGSYLKGADDKLKNFRCVYQFDLTTMQLVEKPFLCINLKLLKKEFGVNQFMPSAIAVHPVDENIYLLSSVGKVLLIVDRNGNLVQAEKLDPKIFRQPEGICFSPDGKSLFISNEGRKKKGNILQFNSL